jgi:hypothetical protein
MGSARSFAIAVACAVYAAHIASNAAAATERPEARPDEAVRDAGVREHDGFYFHLGTGLSGFNGRLGSDVLDGRLHGISTASDIVVGGTVARGVVIGGAAYTSSILVATFEPDDEFEGEIPPREVDPTGAALSMFGPALTYYPDSLDGLHVDLSAGIATLTGLSYDVGRFGDGEVAVGAGFVLGLGYELWVGDQWSLGVATRLMTALLKEQDHRGVPWLLGVGTFPNVLLGATYH